MRKIIDITLFPDHTYTTADKALSITAFVDNVADIEYRTMVFDLAGNPAQGGLGLSENFYAPPRWFGLTAVYKFLAD